jgi:hypothetical protein
VADLVEALRVDREAEALRPIGGEARRNLAALEVLGDQWVVGRLDAVLHRQVERSGRLAAAAHADQDHVGLGQVLRRLAVVVGKREIDGLDAVRVFLAFRNVRKAADAVVRGDAELRLERLDEGVEHVQNQPLRFTFQDPQDLRVDQRHEDDRPLAFLQCRVVDLADHLVRLVGRVDERPAHMPRLGGELREDRVAEGLGGDAGAVGDEEHGAMGHGGPSGRTLWMIGAHPRYGVPPVESMPIFRPRLP